MPGAQQRLCRVTGFHLGVSRGSSLLPASLPARRPSRPPVCCCSFSLRFHLSASPLTHYLSHSPHFSPFRFYSRPRGRFAQTQQPSDDCMYERVTDLHRRNGRRVIACTSLHVRERNEELAWILSGRRHRGGGFSSVSLWRPGGSAGLQQPEERLRAVNSRHTTTQAPSGGKTPRVGSL